VIFTRRNMLRSFAAASALALTAGGTLAQSALSGKTVKVVVPYPAGGNADTIARIFSEQMARKLGAIVIVDNKPGAAGTIGAESVVRAPPDGTTLLLTVTSQLTSAGMGVKPNYDAVKDFSPIVGIALAPLVMAIPASIPAKTMKEFSALAKTQKMAFGSYGTGTSTHVMQNLLVKQMGGDMVHIPYKGEAPMIADMLGGQIQMGLLPPGVAREMEKAGKMRALAVVGPTRSEFLPDVATFQEQGYRELDWTYGVALYASSKIAPDLLQQLAKAGQEVIKDPEVQKKYRARSIQPWGAGGEELKKRLVIDTVLWNKVLTRVGNLE
jgi:tripartite-type tricarboxylate transporter receptor subunit TctC